MERKRHCERIPLAIVNENQDAMEFIQRLLKNGFLPSRNNTLIHVDSKPDLLAPENMPAADVLDYSKLSQVHDCNSWILPNLYKGLFNGVIWVKPPLNDLLSKEKDTSQQFHVGMRKDSKTLAVDYMAKYFLANCSYSLKSEMDTLKEVYLKMVTIGNVLMAANDDTSTWEHISDENDLKPTVLDIDLQFFTPNSIDNSVYSNTKVYSILDAIFSINTIPSEINCDEFVKKRSEQLQEISKYFQSLKKSGELPKLDEQNPPSFIYSQVELIVEEFKRSNYNLQEVNWNSLYDHCRGIHQLPFRSFTQLEVDTLFEAFEKFLDTFKSPPLVITISRSNILNYESLEGRLLKLLYLKFYCDEPLFYATCTVTPDQETDL